MSRAPDWSTAGEDEDASVRSVRAMFADMNDAEKQRLLAELLNLCNSQQLAFVQGFVSPRLKKDPFTTFPDELCLRVSWLADLPLEILTDMRCTDPYIHRRSTDASTVFSGFKEMEGVSER